MSSRAGFLYDVRPRRLTDALRGRRPEGGPGNFIAHLLACLLAIGLLGLDAEFRAWLFADAAELWASLGGFVAAIPAIWLYRRYRRRQGDIYLGEDDDR